MKTYIKCFLVLASFLSNICAQEIPEHARDILQRIQKMKANQDLLPVSSIIQMQSGIFVCVYPILILYVSSFVSISQLPVNYFGKSEKMPKKIENGNLC